MDIAKSYPNTAKAHTRHAFWIRRKLDTDLAEFPDDECITWPFFKKKGYAQTTLKRKAVRVHRIIMFHFHGDPAEGQEARHLCHNRACCNPKHLKWGSHSENMKDSKRDGKIAHGENATLSKFTEQDVIEIRQKAAMEWPATELAKEYGMALSNVYAIISRKTWRHLP